LSGKVGLYCQIDSLHVVEIHHLQFGQCLDHQALHSGQHSHLLDLRCSPWTVQLAPKRMLGSVAELCCVAERNWIRKTLEGREAQLQPFPTRYKPSPRFAMLVRSCCFLLLQQQDSHSCERVATCQDVQKS
jgi:hypothetical protein